MLCQLALQLRLKKWIAVLQTQVTAPHGRQTNEYCLAHALTKQGMLLCWHVTPAVTKRIKMISDNDRGGTSGYLNN